MPAAYRAIIFDCDGTLVDSERIACGLAAQGLTAAGYPIDSHAYLQRFCGVPTAEALKQLQVETGRDLAPAYAAQNIPERTLAAFRAELQPVAGAAQTLADITVPVAVASGSGLERIRLSLQVTGLSRFFGDHVYSAASVPHPKPAPDVYLLAARQLRIPAPDCLAVEDSVAGIKAAQAAGMAVAAYLGGSHVDAAWRAKVAMAQPTFTVDRLEELLAL